jgi:hexosaminidase
VTTNGKIQTLENAYSRYTKLMFPHEVSNEKLKNAIQSVQVSVSDPSEDYPQLETDESYTLDIKTDQTISLTSTTIYGALRGLETLSQLILYDFDTQSYYISSTPIHIEDIPRYGHRGILLDTSRHYQPLSFLETFIDSISYAKYNVLHWHVVDTQSFPFQSRTYPKLWDGAYSKQERYTQQDIRYLVEYGRQRGIKIMIEFDMPGHAGSWCTGYPEICPSTSCLQPLNPASNLTFPLITSLLSECAGKVNDNQPALFPYQLLHLGGDEVSYTCWAASNSIQQWEQENNLNGSEDTYKYFVDKAATITRSLDRLPIQWVEVFEHFGNTLDTNTIVHVWKEKSTLDGVLQAGYRALLSNQDDWYLE